MISLAPDIPVTNLRGCTIVNMNTPEGDLGAVLLITPNSGLGFNNQAISAPFAMKISDSINYEISFWLKQLTDESSLELSVDTFNADFIETSTYDIKTTLNNKNFLPPAPNKILSIPNKFYFVRHILFGHTQKAMLGKQPNTSLAVGTNLVMSENTRNLFVNIKNIHPTQNIFIWKFQVKPLSTPFSTGFIQSGNLLEIWRKNNNQTYSNDKVDSLAKQFLLPYNTAQSVINL